MDKLRWTTQAVEDVEAICVFIAKDSTLYARLFGKDILQAVKQLGDFPKSGRVL
ncbi:MAG: type II toxin-antitoxin system RelE/ParE family toxin [Candidatus Omnitrophota bacterium]